MPGSSPRRGRWQAEAVALFGTRTAAARTACATDGASTQRGPVEEWPDVLCTLVLDLMTSDLPMNVIVTQPEAA